MTPSRRPALRARAPRPTALLGRALVVGLVAVGCVGAPAPSPAAAQERRLSAVVETAAVGTAERSRLADRASRSARRTRLAPPATATRAATTGARVVVTERLPIAFRTVRREDASRYRGSEAVVRRGRDGVLERTYADLGPGGRALLSEERVQEPVTRVVAVGTRPRPTYGGLDWPALARCESGGDPRAVSRTGRYRGLYQFSLSTWRSVGGTGDPIDHSRDSQTARAYALYQRDGRAPWPHCGRHL